MVTPVFSRHTLNCGVPLAFSCVQAEGYQKRSRMVMCIMILILLVVGFGLALFVKAI